MMNSLKVKFGNYSKFEKKKFPFIYTFIAFPVLQFAVFWVYVNASSIALSFRTPLGAFTLDNFKEVFSAFTGLDRYGFNLWDSILRSWKLWLVGEFILFPIGLITSYVLFRRILGHYIFRVCYIIPGMMGAVMWTSLIQYMVSSEGVVTEFLKMIGVALPKEALRNGLFGSAATSFNTIIGIKIIMGLVGNNAVLTGAFARIPDSLYESADLDGAGFWRTFFQIVLPCVGSTIATLLTFSLCGFMTADYNVFLYSNGTGEPGMSTVGFLLYNITYQISLTGGNSSSYGYPAALGLFLTVITLPVVLIGRRLMDKIFDTIEL